MKPKRSSTKALSQKHKNQKSPTGPNYNAVPEMQEINDPWSLRAAPNGAARFASRASGCSLELQSEQESACAIYKSRRALSRAIYKSRDPVIRSYEFSDQIVRPERTRRASMRRCGHSQVRPHKHVARRIFCFRRSYQFGNQRSSNLTMSIKLI